MIPTIAVCIFIAILIATICNIFIKCMLFIALSIVKRNATINCTTDIIIILICTFIICIYFLI